MTAPAVAQDGPAITNDAEPWELAELACQAATAAHDLYRAAFALRGATAGDGALIFAALREFQARRDDAERRAGAVISHAVTRHGYY